jgi:hypothetical protein
MSSYQRQGRTASRIMRGKVKLPGHLYSLEIFVSLAEPWNRPARQVPARRPSRRHHRLR